MEDAVTSRAGLLKTNTLKISLFAIISVFIFELIAGITTNSLALATDSIHALLDAAVTGILLVATKLALKPRDIEHTYGHGKIENIGGFIGGMTLFFIAIFFIYEAIQRIGLGSGQEIIVNPGIIGFAAIAYTLSIDGFRILLLRRTLKQTQSVTIRSDFYHAFTDLASTGAALAGLWLVSIGFLNGDSFAAIALGVFLAYLSARFVYYNALELTDTISPKLVSAVRDAVKNTQGVLECKDVKMRRVGRDIFIDVTITLRANITFENAHNISAIVEKNIIKNISDSPNPNLNVVPDITVHFEPIWTSDLPAESLIEKVALEVSGVKGVHNVSVARSSNEAMFVSLHIQVDRLAKLSDAHAIANRVEEMLKNQITGVKHITVHIEPIMPVVNTLKQIVDKSIEEKVKETLANTREIKEIVEILVYRTDENILKIDINCKFSGKEDSIEKIHQLVSDAEKKVQLIYKNSIVTIHAEPE